MNTILEIPEEAITKEFSVIGEDTGGIPCLFSGNKHYYVLFYEGPEDINTNLNTDLHSAEVINQYIMINSTRYESIEDDIIEEHNKIS